MEKGWEKLRGKPLRRSLSLWRFFSVGTFRLIRANATDKDELTARTAEWLRDGLIRLGPTMIKLGQVFSSRTDLLHPAYVEALQSLQDAVPVVSAETVREVLHAELGAPVDLVFDEFEERPIAGASLGQVHRARLRGSSTLVAIKVQRRSLRALFDTDFANLRLLARGVDAVEGMRRRRKGRAGDSSRNWLQYTDDAAELLYLETDYNNEAANAERFADSLPPGYEVIVPRVFRNLTTARVLTMEFVPSVKLTNAHAVDRLGLDRQRLCRGVVDLFLEQLLATRVLHCDPHPGNLCVSADGSGKLVLYDYGMVDEIPTEVQRGMRMLALTLFGGSPNPTPDELDEEGERLVSALEQMGFLSPTADRAAVKKVGRFVVKFFKASQRGDKTDDVSATVGSELQGLLDRGEIAFPSIFTLVARAYASVDGISRALDPKFDFTKAIEPYVGRLIREEYERQGAQRRQALMDELFSVLFMPRRVAYVERAMRSLQEGEIELRARSFQGEAAVARVERRLDRVQGLLIVSAGLNVLLAMGVRTLPVRPLSALALGLGGLSAFRLKGAAAGRQGAKGGST